LFNCLQRLAFKGIPFSGFLCVRVSMIIIAKVCEHSILQVACGNFTRFTA